MELRHLRYFVAIAEEGSFTRAAARVGIGQPPLSQQIKDLEGEIGTALFRRLPHGVELTDAGRAFYPGAIAVLKGAEGAAAAALDASRGIVGELRIGYTASALFHHLVVRLIREYQRVLPMVKLTLHEAPTSSLVEALRRGALDAAFIRPGPVDPVGCEVTLVDEEEFVVALPEESPLIGGSSISLGDLAGERFILFPREAGPALFDEVISACRRAGFEPGEIQEAPQIASVANLVAAGMGVALVPLGLVWVKVPGVTYRPIDAEGLNARLVLALPEGEKKATALRLREGLEGWLNARAPREGNHE